MPAAPRNCADPSRCTPPVKDLVEPYTAYPLQFEADPIELASRLAAVTDDPQWPDDLRAEARLGPDGLETDAVTDEAIAAALTSRARSRDR